MIWSLNEIESTAKKAARGASMSWGMAEEAGRATRWLCAAGWPGAENLAALLREEDGAAWAALRPRIAGDSWTAQGGLLCPIAAGAAIADRAQDWAAGNGATLGPVAHPLLLVPFVAMAADMAGTTLRIGWEGVVLSRGKGETRAEIADPAALTAPYAESVTLDPSDGVTGDPLQRVYRGEISPEAAQSLNAFAQRTYAPATPESRLAGAGAGLSDND